MMTHVNLSRLNPYELHKHLINEYYMNKPGDAKTILTRDTSRDKRDADVIRENHRFLWNTSDEVDTWEKRLAKKYYDKLFKEYCICDLSRYKENKIAMRWRIEKEVITGKGQFVCGNKMCGEKDDLKSWEVNFAYSEEGEKKNALVKLRLCRDCSKRLNYHTMKREVKRIHKRKRSKGIRLAEIPNGSVAKTRPSSSHETNNGDSVEEVRDELNDGCQQDVQKLEETCWSKGPEIEDKSREEEFDEYLENLLL